MGADGGAFLRIKAALGTDEESCGAFMLGKRLAHGPAALFVGDEEMAALRPGWE